MDTTKKVKGDWIRRHPPLVIIAAALVLALFALPSALNLPQANPSQTAEYAPVPGNSHNSASGNFAGLGLGTGGSGSGAGQASGVPLQAGAGGAALPSQYDCVGSPPRQTEDPLSPPCVPYWRGDNGGATYQGVSASQIVVLFYLGTYWNYANCDSSAPPADSYYDI